MASEGLNKVMLLGHIGGKPELKYGQGGNALLRLRLATTERFVDRSKERQERTTWHTVIFWGKRGESLSKHLDSGQQIYVEGRIQVRDWEGDDGKKRYVTEIVGTQLLFLGGGKREGYNQRSNGGGYNGDGAPSNENPPNYGGSQTQAEMQDDEFGDSGLPF